MTTPAPRGRALRASPAVYFTSYGLSLLGPGIASVVLPLLVPDRTGDVLAAMPAIHRAVQRTDIGFRHIHAGGRITKMWP